MNKMRAIFDKMMSNNEKILVTYFPLCDPELEDQVQWAKDYFANGTTVLEMGLPYHNPVLDGKTVKDSMLRALEHHTLEDAFKVVGEINKACPNNILEIMTYYENVELYGLEKFARKCKDVGVDAILAPNMPDEVKPEADRIFKKYDLINLRFATYNLTEAEIEDLKQNADGFVFVQAVDGATGPQEKVDLHVGENIRKLKEAGITTPAVAGFGISNAEQVSEMIKLKADGCIVGSSVISAIIKGTGKEFIHSLREALDK